MNIWEWLLGFLFGRRRPRPAPTSDEPRAPQGNPPAAPPPRAPPPNPTPTPIDTAPQAPAEVDFLDSLAIKSRDAAGPADYAAAAAELRCELEAIQAVAQVESGRFGAFDVDTGRMIILFEPHQFSRRTGRRFDRTNPSVSYPTWDPKKYPASQAGRWAQLQEAYGLNPSVALACASWGRFQVIGFNHRLCGYETVEAFVTDLSQGDARHLAAFVKFIQADPVLLRSLRARDWARFARGYNGPAYSRNDYDGKMRRAYERLKQSGPGV